MATDSFGIVNTTSSLTSQNAKFQREIWEKGAQLFEGETDFYQQFEGTGDKAVICSKTDLSKGAGSTINFMTLAGLYGDGVKGDEQVGDKAEQLRGGGYQLTVDYVRHASGYNRRTKEKTTLVQELTSGVPEMLGSWLGRKKTEMLEMQFRERSNLVYISNSGNNNQSLDDILGTDVLSMDGITSAGAAMSVAGGMPAKISKDGENDIESFLFISPKEALVNLQATSDYKEAQREAGTRERENLIFKGGYSDINGQKLIERNVKDHPGYGPLGNPQQPKAKLGVAITAANTAQNIEGGGSAAAAAVANVSYFKYFHNAPYAFTPDDIIAADVSTVRYCLIINITTDRKMGFYQFTGNTGKILTMTARLRAASSGIASTTVGEVTWGTDPWSASILTDAHPVGSLIIETNAKGVPLAYTFGLGAWASLRGYGSERAQRDEQKYDGNFFVQSYISSVFGQVIPVRPDGTKPNSICIAHACYPAGVFIPIVTG